MSLRTSLLPVVDTLRALTGPSVLDIRTVKLTIRTRVWSGSCLGEGTPTDTDLVFPQQYKIRYLTGKEIASSGGRFSADTVKVGPITPAYTGGGYTQAQIFPETTSDNVEFIYILDGPMAGEYACQSTYTDKPFSYFIFLVRRRTTP